jgi:hypothetical protein
LPLVSAEAATAKAIREARAVLDDANIEPPEQMPAVYRR